MAVGQPASTSKGPHPVAGAAIILVGCALSAGVHFALVPEHLAESPRLGAGFLVAGALLLVVGLAAFAYPRAEAPPLAAALACGGLIAAYAASRTVGLPGLETEPEPVDAIGLITQVPQLLVLGLGLRLYRNNRGRRTPLHETRRIQWTGT